MINLVLSSALQDTMISKCLGFECLVLQIYFDLLQLFWIIFMG